MTDDELRRVVREFRGAMSAELEGIHQRIDGMESAIVNELRSLARRVARIEDLGTPSGQET